MNKEYTEKINNVSISINSSLIDALNKMDSINRKLLIVFDGKSFVSVLSIGDLQRAIIANTPFDTSIKSVLRDSVEVGSVSDTKEKIKSIMLQYRTEFMPILDGSGVLVDVVFWEDLFLPEDRTVLKDLVDTPVVIMAGGKGTRLRPITNVIPKPLIPLGDKPIIELIIERFLKYGATNYLLSINYKGDWIRRFFDDIKDREYEIEYFQETKALGTAGSLSLLKEKITKTFFVSNCDILIDQDYNEVLQYHNENRNELTIIAAIKKYNIPYGILETTNEGLLENIKEKPELVYQINSGVYILEPHLIDEVPENEFYNITDLIEKVADRGGRVGVWPVSEKSWLDIGDWNEYLESMKLVNR